MKSQAKPPGNAITRHWDLIASVVIAAIFGITSWTRDEKLASLGTVLAAGMAGGLALGAATLVASRWLSDMLAKDEYGELIRAIDNSESRARRPYEIVARTSFVTALSCLLTILIYQAVPDKLVIILATLTLGLGLYSILGALTLVRITHRHQDRAARLRALKEENQREMRNRKNGN